MTLKELIEVLRKTGGCCPLPDVEAFEAKLGVGLPNPYRQFLLQYNGGSTDGLLASRETIEAGEDFIGPTLFWGIGYPKCDLNHPDDTNWTLVELNLQIYEGRIPSDTIGIADDVFGNVFLLGIKGISIGKIWFWDHEEEHLNNESWDGLVQSAKNTLLLANSFEEWIGTLYEDDLEDD